MSKPIVVAHDLKFELFISAEQIQERIRQMGVVLSRQYQEQTPLFLAILNGSFIFAADLIRACDMDCEISFIKVASYDGLKSSGQTRTLIGLEADIKDRSVLIIEDIVDSGRTLSQLIPKLQAQKPRSLEVVSLFQKPDALIQKLEVHHLGFSIPDKFIIGYGLDYNGLGRNLADVYQLIQD